MFYVFAHPPAGEDIGTTKEKIPLRLTAGVVHQVDVLFQDGCLHKIHVQIFHGSFQVWPSNRGENIRGNATVVSFREFYELPAGGSELTAHIWGDEIVADVEVIIQIGLLSKRVLQPLSFEELLAAASGVK